MKVIRLILFFIILSWQVPAQAQGNNSAEWPIYQGKDLKINMFRLRPHRSQLWPRSESLDKVFNNAQISYMIERGDYYGPDQEPRKGIRIRWVSNTHSFEDAAYVDAETFGIIKQTATLGGIKNEQFTHAYFGDGKVIRTILRNDSIAKSSETKLKYKDYYHLITMPYVFASSDLEAGSKFRLPFYSSTRDQETLINVHIVGNVDFVDEWGQARSAWRVDTDHGYAKLEWYIDKNKAPYLIGYRWQSFSGGELTSDSKRIMTKWLEFEGDDFHQIIKKD